MDMTVAVTAPVANATTTLRIPPSPRTAKQDVDTGTGTGGTARKETRSAKSPNGIANILPVMLIDPRPMVLVMVMLMLMLMVMARMIIPRRRGKKIVTVVQVDEAVVHVAVTRRKRNINIKAGEGAMTLFPFGEV
jgi:hypothetical protein